jgi:hypothetical protein
LCGSGRKYKQCCQPTADVLKFEGANFLHYVLRVIPRKRYADLPDSRVDRAAVAHVAMEWNDSGDVKAVTALLEPWFAKGRPLGDQHGLMFDMLMDAYLRLGQERKREALLERMMSSGNRALRASALQRRASMLADKGQVSEAWRVFLEAQRENPDDPAIGLLEVTLLVSGGDIQRARERARFWVMRMERERDPDLQPAIEFMRQVINDPGAALASASTTRYPEVDRLMRLFKDAPVPQAHYDVLSEDDDAMLCPRAAVHALDQAWRNVYPQQKPKLVTIQLDTDAMWDDAAPWLEFLASSPMAWHSFDVMDDLVMAVEAIAELGLDLALLEPMLARGRALLEINLRASGYEGKLPWMAGPNRAALRILAHNVFRDCHAASRIPAARKRFLDNAKHLLHLNPADNHGVRAELSRVLLEDGEAQAALDLCSAYPDDLLCETSMNRILALYRLGRSGDALGALAALPHSRHLLVQTLLAKRAKAPARSSSARMADGGKVEAWEYRDSHLELWQRDGALEWLREVWRTIER